MDTKKENNSPFRSQEKLVTKYGKLLSERPKKKLGYSRAYIYEPADFFEKQYGTLYFVLEIASPDPQAAEIGEMIIETMKEEYFADLDRDVLVSFESALKATNKELADLAAAGKTSWLNKINAICACLSDNTLHITQVGSAEAYLLRNNQLAHISESLFSPTKNPDPLKTFVNIASGQLEPEDRILISTPGLFYSMSLDNIKKIIADRSPAHAVKKLAESLKEEEDALGTSLLVIRALTEDKIANEEVVEEEEEIWIAEPKGRLEAFSEKAKPILSRGKNAIGKGFQKVKRTSKKTVLPLFGKASTGIKGKLKDMKEKKETQNNITQLKETEQPITKKETEEVKEPLEKISEKPPEEKAMTGKMVPESQAEIRKISEKMSAQPKKSQSLVKTSKIKSFFQKGSQTILSFFTEKSDRPQKTSNKYLFIAIIALVIFLASIGMLYYKKRANNEIKRVEGIYNDAYNKEQKAEASLIYKDRSGAKTLLTEANSEAESIKNNKTYGPKATALISKIREQLDKADIIVRVQNPQAIGDFGTDSKSSCLFLIGTDYYSFQENGTTAYRFVTKDKSVTKIKKTLTPGKFISAASTVDNTLLLYDDGPGLSLYDPAANSIVPQNISLGGNWEKGLAISAYQNYLYILSPQTNKIYRHAKTLAGYSVGVDYLVSNPNLSKTVSITTGETVFVLSSDGQIMQFSRGSEIPFAIKNMPFSLEKPTFIFTKSGYTNIYIIDQAKKAVIVIDANTGEYKGQYTSDSFNNLKGLFVDEATKKIYTLSDNKTYSITLL